jgi:hypothetical protein
MWLMHRSKIIAAVIAVLIVAVGVGAWLTLSTSSNTAADDVAAIEKQWLENRSAEPVVKVNPSRQSAVLPGQSTAPTRRLEAVGKCKAALDAGRAVMTEYPSGLMPEAGKPMQKALDGIDDACPTDIKQNFRSQEMGTWNVAAIPVTAAPN